MLEELMEKLPPNYITTERLQEFVFALKDKFDRGKTANRGVPSYSPIEEAEQECLDLCMYSVILYYRLQRLEAKLDALGSKKS